MSKEELLKKEKLDINELRELIDELDENFSDELATILFYDLLDMKVFIPMNESVLLLLNKQGELSKKFIESPKFLTKLLYLIEEDGGWLPIYFENKIYDDMPKELCLIEIKFEDFYDERFVDLSFIKGLIIDNSDRRLFLNKETLKFLLLIKKLKNDEVVIKEK